MWSQTSQQKLRCYQPLLWSTQEHQKKKTWEFLSFRKRGIKKAPLIPADLRARWASSGSWGASAGSGTPAPWRSGRRAWASSAARRSSPSPAPAPAPAAGTAPPGSSPPAPSGSGTAPWCAVPPPRPPCPPSRTRTASAPSAAASSFVRCREAAATMATARRGGWGGDQGRVSLVWASCSWLSALLGRVCLLYRLVSEQIGRVPCRLAPAYIFFGIIDGIVRVLVGQAVCIFLFLASPRLFLHDLLNRFAFFKLMTDAKNDARHGHIIDHS